jgi:branched-chain amino acid transport system ATP-binding protein
MGPRHRETIEEEWTMNFLETISLTKNFGGLTAVNDVNFQMNRGELRTIIGPNGAGKTTFLNMIAGNLMPTSGEICFKGQNITNLPPHMVSHKGIARSYQIINLFPNSTVFENIRVAAQSRKVIFNFWSDVKRFDGINQKALSILETLRLTDRKETSASNLPYGEQRHLEIGIALATEPELLLMDEPTAGLTPEESLRMIELIKTISKGLTIILVAHDMDLVMNVSDKITVLHQGRILAEGRPEEIQKDEEVQKVYLGGQYYSNVA